MTIYKSINKFTSLLNFQMGIVLPIYYAINHNLFGMLLFDAVGIIGYFSLKQYFKKELEQ